jgi:hypothetical protein
VISSINMERGQRFLKSLTDSGEVNWADGVQLGVIPSRRLHLSASRSR